MSDYNGTSNDLATLSLDKLALVYIYQAGLVAFRTMFVEGVWLILNIKAFVAWLRSRSMAALCRTYRNLVPLCFTPFSSFFFLFFFFTRLDSNSFPSYRRNFGIDLCTGQVAGINNPWFRTSIIYSPARIQTVTLIMPRGKYHRPRGVNITLIGGISWSSLSIDWKAFFQRFKRFESWVCIHRYPRCISRYRKIVDRIDRRRRVNRLESASLYIRVIS